MAGPIDDSLSRIERQLEGAERDLAGVNALNEQETQRVAERMDRLASQLLEVSAPLPIGTVHAEEGVRPASSGDFERLAEEMDKPDGEG